MDKIDCLVIGYNNYSSGDGTEECYDPQKRIGTIEIDGRLYSFPEYYKSVINQEKVFSNYGIDGCFDLSIASICTYLNAKKMKYAYINSFESEIKKLKSVLAKQVKLIYIITTYYTSVEPINDIIKFIKNFNSEAQIAVGGFYVLDCLNRLEEKDKQVFLKSVNADFFLTMIETKPIVEIVEQISANSDDFESINNLLIKQNDDYVSTKNVVSSANESTINWSLFTDSLNSIASVRTSVSCPFACNFCSFPFYGGKYRAYNLEKVKDELDSLKRIGIKRICFIDDTLNYPVERFRSLLEIMIDNKYDFKWHGYFRCKYLNEEIISLMKKSGCELAALGLESGNQKILNNVNKNENVYENSEIIRLLKNEGIITFGYFILGTPGETVETYLDTLQFIKQTKPDFYRVSSWFYDHHSPFYKNRHRNGIQGSGYRWRHLTMDSEKAEDLVKNLFLEIEEAESLYYYPNFTSIIQLLNENKPLPVLKQQISQFNYSVKQYINQREGD